ncbi:MAG: VWA domain-containing protein [Planctomycetota bacterium]
MATDTGLQPPQPEAAATQATTDADPSATSRVLRFARKAGVVGAVVSLVVHFVWLVVALFTTWGGGGDGKGPPGPPAEIELAVMTATELATVRAEALDAQTPAVDDLAADQPEVPIEISIDIGEIAISADVSTDTLSASLGAGDVDGASVDTGATGGGTSFFGVEARGNRFVYIVDISGSMSVGGKIEALREELGRSLGQLSDPFKFSVITYNSEATPLTGSSWSSASRARVRRAISDMQEIEPGGGTQPAGAFAFAFNLRPPPDAIYFMTDGEFDPQVAALVRSQNRDPVVPVHCISLVSRSSAPLLQQIADDSDGSYTHIAAAGGGP